MFSVCPLNAEEWWTVFKISVPVLLLDEALKFTARKFIDGNKQQMELFNLILAWLLFFAIAFLF